jgi:N-acetylmuramoyl-L-alanine amidase
VKIMTKSFPLVVSILLTLGVVFFYQHQVQAEKKVTLVKMNHKNVKVQMKKMNQQLQQAGYNYKNWTSHTNYADTAVQYLEKKYHVHKDSHRDTFRHMLNKAEQRPKRKNHVLRVSPAELSLLAHTVYGEARGESFEGQVAVAAVILNRVESDAFPDSIRAVVYQPNAFTAVDDGQIDLKPDREAYRAAKEALMGADPTHGALYYYNPEIATSTWMEKKAKHLKAIRIGNHLFLK